MASKKTNHLIIVVAVVASLVIGVATGLIWQFQAVKRACRDSWVGEARRPGLKNLSGPGVLLASAQVTVTKNVDDESGIVTFPIPLLTNHQVPLTFDITVEPEDALVEYRWVLRYDQRNWLCEVRVDPPESGAKVRWESLVLVDHRKDSRLPVAKKPKVPSEAKPWTESTACIQSQDEAIALKAKQLGAGQKSVGEYVTQVLRFTSTNKGKRGAPFLTLDASAALDCGGSCTSRANLAAALFRAGGIPARTSAHLPTWSGPLYEHWHVEYWHPGAGWTWVEPTLGRLQPQTSSMVVINIANPEDEQSGFDPIIRHSGVMLGVPRYSVHELSPSLTRHRGLYTHNYARAMVHLDGSSSAIKSVFKKARTAWKSLAVDCQIGRANPELTASVKASLSEENVDKERVTEELGRVLVNR